MITNFEFELQYGSKIIGVDEVGRGPLAGPVVACAIIVDKDVLKFAVNDSKKVAKAKREKIHFGLITNFTYAIGMASVEEIDKLNILQATFLAMKRAIEGLPANDHYILVDGNKPPFPSAKITPIIGGDSKCASIAAASIIAKVTRDKIMHELSLAHPQYLWHKNSGYGTKEHIEAIKSFGSTPYHRKSFIKNI